MQAGDWIALVSGIVAVLALVVAWQALEATKVQAEEAKKANTNAEEANKTAADALKAAQDANTLAEKANQISSESLTEERLANYLTNHSNMLAQQANSKSAMANRLSGTSNTLAKESNEISREAVQDQKFQSNVKFAFQIDTEDAKRSVDSTRVTCTPKLNIINTGQDVATEVRISISVPRMETFWFAVPQLAPRSNDKALVSGQSSEFDEWFEDGFQQILDDIRAVEIEGTLTDHEADNLDKEKNNPALVNINASYKTANGSTQVFDKEVPLRPLAAAYKLHGL